MVVKPINQMLQTGILADIESALTKYKEQLVEFYSVGFDNFRPLMYYFDGKILFVYNIVDTYSEKAIGRWLHVFVCLKELLWFARNISVSF